MFSNLILSALLLSTIALGRTDLEGQYCSLRSGTTPEIVMGVNLNSQSRASTELILRTQSFISGTKVVSLSYIENQGSLTIEETDSTLANVIHSENTANTLVYIDGRNQYVIAKEVTSTTTAAFSYVVFKANLGTSGLMTKTTISSLTDSASNDISKMKLKEIIDITDT